MIPSTAASTHNNSRSRTAAAGASTAAGAHGSEKRSSSRAASGGETGGEGSGSGNGNVMKQQLFKTKVCRHFMSGRCKYGAGCTFAHSAIELQTRPDFRRTKLCSKLNCQDGSCGYAHSMEEIRDAYDVICPAWLAAACKNGQACPLSHNSTHIEELIVAHRLASDDAASGNVNALTGVLPQLLLHPSLLLAQDASFSTTTNSNNISVNIMNSNTNTSTPNTPLSSSGSRGSSSMNAPVLTPNALYAGGDRLYADVLLASLQLLGLGGNLPPIPQQQQE